jgi:hypothetical protein
MEARVTLKNGFVVHGQLRSLTSNAIEIRNYRVRSGRVSRYKAADIQRIDVLGDMYAYSQKEGGFLSFRRRQPKHCDILDAYVSLLAPGKKGHITTIDSNSATVTLLPEYRLLYVLLRLDGRGERCDFSKSVVTDADQNEVGTVYAWVDGLAVRCRRASGESVVNPILRRIKDRESVQKFLEFFSGRYFDDRRNVLLILQTDDGWILQGDLLLRVAGFRLPLRASLTNLHLPTQTGLTVRSSARRPTANRAPADHRRLKGF